MEVNMPTAKNEININTAMHLITIVIVILGVGASWQDNKNTNEEQQRWMDGHEKYHAQRQIESKTRDANVDARLKALELADQVQKQNEYRLAQVEKSVEIINDRIAIQGQRFDNTISELRKDLSSVSTQIELSKQILLRLEAKQSARSELDGPPPTLKGPL